MAKEQAINGFLVVGRTPEWEVEPLLLCATEEEAVEFIGTLGPRGAIVGADVSEDVNPGVYDAISIFEFRDGRPVRSRNVRTF
jgi:hypothetical protein